MPRTVPRFAKESDGEAGNELGLEAGHEDARPDRELEPAEPRPAGQMLQRHPTGPFRHQIVEPLWDRRTHDHQLVHLAGGRPQRSRRQCHGVKLGTVNTLSLIHISEPTRRTPISYAVFCLKKKKTT